jgi:hypothetical protein
MQQQNNKTDDRDDDKRQWQQCPAYSVSDTDRVPDMRDRSPMRFRGKENTCVVSVESKSRLRVARGTLAADKHHPHNHTGTTTTGGTQRPQLVTQMRHQKKNAPTHETKAGRQAFYTCLRTWFGPSEQGLLRWSAWNRLRGKGWGYPKAMDGGLTGRLPGGRVHWRVSRSGWLSGRHHWLVELVRKHAINVDTDEVSEAICTRGVQRSGIAVANANVGGQ